MIDAWTTWTLAACHQPDAHGALTTGAFVGEGSAVSQFNAGTLDLAYTAAGNIDAVDLNQDRDAPGPRRPYVAVPIGINAVTLGLANGRPSGTRKVPFHTVSLTAGEAAKLFAGGKDGLSTDEINAISSRPGNEDFNPTNPQRAPFFANIAGSQPVQGAAEAESTSWIGTNFLHRLAPSDFAVPDLPKYGEAAGRPAGARRLPGAGRPVLHPRRATCIRTRRSCPRPCWPALGGGLGGVWVLSDMAIADELTMTPVALGNADGAFVAPTPETMTAAGRGMEPDASGSCSSIPTVTARLVSPSPIR